MLWITCLLSSKYNSFNELNLVGEQHGANDELNCTIYECGFFGK